MQPGWIVGAAVLGAVLGVPLTMLAGRARRPTKYFSWYVHLAASAVTAVLFALVATRFSQPLELAAYLVFSSAAVLLCEVDLADRRLPDMVVLPTLMIVASLLLTASAIDGSWMNAIGVVAGGTGMFVLYFVLALISPKAMGMGDVKLAAVIGVAAGYLGLTVWLGALFGGFVVGALVSLVLLATRKVKMKSLVPFGPSMLAGVFLAIVIL